MTTEEIPTNDSAITVTVDLGRLLRGSGMTDEYGDELPAQISDLVLDAAAKLVFDKATNRYWNDDKPEDGLSELRADLAKRMRSVTDDEIREAVKPLMAQAMADVLQPTTPYGKPKGKPKTLQQIIIKQAKKVLTEERRARGAGYNTTTLVKQVFEDEIERALKSDLQKAVKDESAKLVQMARDSAAEVIAATLAKMKP